MTPLTWLRNRWQAHRLRRSVEEHLDVLPVANAQLREVSRQMEEAVSQIGANFEKMVESARQGVNEASRLMGASESAHAEQRGIGATIAGSRAALEDLLTRIVRDAEASGELVARMNSVRSGMERIEHALADVDRISFGNLILSLNAKVEAAHLGAHGQGFELVAEEISVQAAESEKITESIRGTITTLAEDVRLALRNIAAMACADHSLIAALQAETRKALDALEQSLSAMQRSVSDSGARNEALASSIVGAVQSLQFQDRVSQQIAHVVDALESMQLSLTTSLDSAAGALPLRSDGAAERLARSYTTDGERSVHVAVLNGDDAARAESRNEPAPADDIELF